MGQMKYVESEKVTLLYVVSLGFSGSTLAAILLGSHKDIATVGELSGPDQRLSEEMHPCSCGEMTTKCKFWRNIHSRLEDRGLRYSIFQGGKKWKCSNNRYLNYALTSPLRTPLLSKIQCCTLKALPHVKAFTSEQRILMQEILKERNASVFLDTSKDIDRLQVLRSDPNIDLKVIHLVRDGRGQLNSRLRRGKSAGAVAKHIYDFDRRARKFRKIVGEDHYLLVRYEDLCVDTSHCLSNVAEYCNLDPDRFSPNYIGNTLHLFGNPMSRRFTGNVRLDERWKSQLSDADLAIFERVAGSRNRWFGYY